MSSPERLIAWLLDPGNQVCMWTSLYFQPLSAVPYAFSASLEAKWNSTMHILMIIAPNRVKKRVLIMFVVGSSPADR